MYVCLCQYNDIYTYVWMKAGLHNRTDRVYTKEVVNTNASVTQDCVISIFFDVRSFSQYASPS